ncbi:unnamed protein product, partial [Anisakis simplex]|uniref:ATP7 (inferred by orthology to a D. melanogaster protein) n=1 Tax=Anisakis simplex TaxID=6269 RepID=A0A0M3KFK0_ANISI
MTCHSCVNNIQDNIRSKDGIKSIVVSLQNCEATVEFNASKLNGESVAEMIGDMGYDTKLKFVKDNLVSAESDNPKYREAIIDIQGMTCHSCVNNIQDNMSSKDGIQSIVVSLKDCEGRVIFDTAKWTDVAPLIPALQENKSDEPPRNKLSSILRSHSSTKEDDKKQLIMNFDDKSVRMSRKNTKFKQGLEKCTLSVEVSFVPIQTSTIIWIRSRKYKILGVQSIVVALMSSKADVTYDASLISAQQLADEISNLGYRSTVIDTGSTNHSKLNLTIVGMSSSICASRIESHVISRKGVESCTVSLPTSTAYIEYTPAFIGPRDI